MIFHNWLVNGTGSPNFHMRDAHVQNIFNQVFNICRREFFTNYNFIFFKRSIGEVSIAKILVACKLSIFITD